MATQAEIDALPDTLEITLKPPITIGAEIYTTLTFREPTAGELQSAAQQGDDLTSTIWALAGMAVPGVNPAVIKRMPARQFRQASAFLASFTQDAETTGASA